MVTLLVCLVKRVKRAKACFVALMSALDVTSETVNDMLASSTTKVIAPRS